MTGAGKPWSAQNFGNSSSQPERVGVPAWPISLAIRLRPGRGRVACERLGELVLGQPQRVERVVDRALERLVFEPRRHVEERPRRRGDADAELGRDVAPAERGRSVDADALGAAVADDRDLERLVPLAPVAPQRHRRAVAERRAGSAGEHGGGGPLVRRGRRMADGVHAPEHAVQPADSHPVRRSRCRRARASCSCRRVMLPHCFAATPRSHAIARSTAPREETSQIVRTFLPKRGSRADRSGAERSRGHQPVSYHARLRTAAIHCRART